jgi:hypothetical protein
MLFLKMSANSINGRVISNESSKDVDEKYEPPQILAYLA